jgi:predicted permease
LVATAPANLPRLADISISLSVFIFTLVASLIAGLFFGLMPVIKYAGPRINSLIRAGGRALTSSRERLRTRDILAVVQMAFALVLLVGSGLMIRTFLELRRVDPGFVHPAEVQTLHIFIPETDTRDGGAVIRMQENILDRMSGITGVSSAGIVNVLPMTIKAPINGLWAQDQPEQAKRVPKLRRFKFFSPGFLQTMGTPLIAGREFTWTDTYERRPVAMVSENLARSMWGSPTNALGKQIHESADSPWREIIGVIGDEREDGVDHAAPEVAYFPLLMTKYQGNIERAQRSVWYVVRSSRIGTQGFIQEIQRAVWSVNPNLPLAQLRTMGEIYSKSLERTSFTLVMLAIAGAMALLIGLVGIYGVVSYSVSQRRREIGIRLVLGAPAGGVMRMFIRQAFVLGVIGAVTGSLAALGLARLISSLLFQVSASDPLTYASVCSALLIATLLASYLPARRATRVEPVEVLRTE